MLPFSFVFALSLSCWMDENYLNPTCRFIFILPSWITFTYLVVFSSYRSFMQYVWKVLRESKSFKTNKNHVFPLVFFFVADYFCFYVRIIFLMEYAKICMDMCGMGCELWWVFGFFPLWKKCIYSRQKCKFLNMYLLYFVCSQVKRFQGFQCKYRWLMSNCI